MRLAAADLDPVPLKRSPNGSIYLPRVNEHRRLRRSLNVSVTFVSALMNNGERGVMEVYLASRTWFSVSMGTLNLNGLTVEAFALLKLRHSSIHKSEDITSGLQHVGPVVGMCPLKQKKRSPGGEETRKRRQWREQQAIITQLC